MSHSEEDRESGRKRIRTDSDFNVIHCIKRRKISKLSESGVSVPSEVNSIDDDSRAPSANHPEMTETPKSCRSGILAKRVSLSRRKSMAIKQKYQDDYDPENDIFMHSDITQKQNMQNLKNEIGKLLGTESAVQSPGPSARLERVSPIKNSPKCVETPCSSKRKSTSKCVKKKLVPECASDPVTPVERTLMFQDSPRQIAHCTTNFSVEELLKVMNFNLRRNSDSNLSTLKALPHLKDVLKDVVAYVDVVSGDEDRSLGVKKALISLGATIAPTFTKEVPVTHVIFHEGRLLTYQKAKKRKIPLVSILWIEACRKAGAKVSEDLFPALATEVYESPVDVKKKLKGRRILNLERNIVSPRKKRDKIKSTESTPTKEDVSKDKDVNCKTPRGPQWLRKEVGDDGAIEFLVQVSGIKEKEFNQLKNSPEPTGSPLAIRLLHKLVTKKKESPYRDSVTDDC